MNRGKLNRDLLPPRLFWTAKNLNRGDFVPFRKAWVARDLLDSFFSLRNRFRPANSRVQLLRLENWSFRNRGRLRPNCFSRFCISRSLLPCRPRCPNFLFLFSRKFAELNRRCFRKCLLLSKKSTRCQMSMSRWRGFLAEIRLRWMGILKTRLVFTAVTLKSGFIEPRSIWTAVFCNRDNNEPQKMNEC